MPSAHLPILRAAIGLTTEGTQTLPPEEVPPTHPTHFKGGLFTGKREATTRFM